MGPPADRRHFGVALLTAAWAGVVGWCQAARWVDVVAHFAATGAVAATVYLMLVRLGVLPTAGDADHRRTALLLLVVTIDLAVGVLWELYEWVGRNWLGNRTIHVGYNDTIFGLTMDGLGTLLAAVLLLTTGLASRRHTG